VSFAIGIVSERDPESTLNPPPCKLISTRDLFSGATEGGVTTRTGTSAIVSFVKFTEYNLSDFFPHLRLPLFSIHSLLLKRLGRIGDWLYFGQLSLCLWANRGGNRYYSRNSHRTVWSNNDRGRGRRIDILQGVRNCN